jgi:hypothetical protein
MARRPRPVTYRQALRVIRDTWLTIVSIAALPGLPAAAQEQLRLLADQLELVITRDNGRGD